MIGLCKTHPQFFAKFLKKAVQLYSLKSFYDQFLTNAFVTRSPSNYLLQASSWINILRNKYSRKGKLYMSWSIKVARYDSYKNPAQKIKKDWGDNFY